MFPNTVHSIYHVAIPSTYAFPNTVNRIFGSNYMTMISYSRLGEPIFQVQCAGTQLYTVGTFVYLFTVEKR